MTDYWYVEPEEPGELGPATDIDMSTHPPLVSRLEYLMNVPPNDEILASFPCYVVSARVRARLTALGATGCTFRSVTVTPGPGFERLWPSVRLPQYWWMDILGSAGVDDLGIAPDLRLVASDRVRTAIEPWMGHAELTNFL